MPPQHIQRPEDLVSSNKVVINGFLSQALVKTERASQFVDDALAFRQRLNDINHLTELLTLGDYKNHLIAAAGFSEKSQAYMPPATLDDALRRVLRGVFDRAGEGWREEILCRYLLTRGDSLGGLMRNLTGATAQGRLADALVDALRRQGRAVEIARSQEGDKVQKLSWENRVLLFDKTPTLIGKNIDAILLVDDNNSSDRDLLARPGAYLACGELKGGIDPAGADEHWKTAKSALDRIRTALEGQNVRLFFVAAAIENAMAAEIFEELTTGRLQHAANLNYEIQLNDLVDWLVAL